MPVTKQLLARGLTDKTLLSATNDEIVPVLREVRETVNRDLVSAELVIESGAIAVDWTERRHFTLALSESITAVTFEDPADVGWYSILVTQGAAFTVAGWPSSVKWFGGGAAPTITATADRVDLIEFYWDGTSYHGTVLQDAV